ncbi:MAG TPA: hypothetical protein VML75_20510 [Kofleriaceae bacterium]|nr:hypothetical protein [Kofleriaceae bacterium]
MDTRALLAWGDLEERRRRRASRGPGRLPPTMWIVALGLLVGAYAAHAAGALGAAEDPARVVRASRLWLALLIGSHALLMFGAPFRMYWRRDSALLGRLSLRGDVLFRAALVRGARATAVVSGASALAALAFAPVAWELALRHLALVGAAAAGAALLAPAAALAAGGLVASDKVEKLFASVGGEFEAPSTGWLGILPGLAATVVVLVLIACADWSLGAPGTAIGHPAIPLAGLGALSLAAAAWALASADRVMLEAVREVSALDQERLAHIERTRPSLLESAMSRSLNPRARRVFTKDVRLARRRYPMPYFLGLVGMVALWIIAGVAPVSMMTWAVAITGSLAAYAVVMSRRRAVPPIEHPGFLRTLPVTETDVGSAKRAQTVLWLLVQLGPTVPVVIVRSPEPATMGLVLGGVVAAGLAAALYTGSVAVTR